ncbi:MAG: hypothetical protein JO107_00135, partial [Hyphomicrobiales bacterium]|nr:hypothetical protein [Hyphomicrobiales bacterium]
MTDPTSPVDYWRNRIATADDRYCAVVSRDDMRAIFAALDEAEARVAKLRETKTPATRGLVNLSKAMWDDAEDENDALRAELARAQESNALLDRMQTTRFLLLDDKIAVCVGGRWDGWKMWRHPDGQWVSGEKLRQIDPASSANEFQVGDSR